MQKFASLSNINRCDSLASSSYFQKAAVLNAVTAGLDSA